MHVRSEKRRSWVTRSLEGDNPDKRTIGLPRLSDNNALLAASTLLKQSSDLDFFTQ
jgi:hypothetical protein